MRLSDPTGEAKIDNANKGLNVRGVFSEIFAIEKDKIVAHRAKIV